MDKVTKDALTKNKNLLSDEALEERKNINKKILKTFAWIIGVPVALIVIAMIFTGGENSVSPLEKDTSSMQEVTQKWYEGGTLHNENALVWQNASQKNKLATCADLVATMWTKKMLKPAILQKINSINDIKPLAKELLVALDGAFKKDKDENKNKQLFTNQKVVDTAIILATITGWL